MDIQDNFQEDQRSKDAEKAYLEFLDDQEEQGIYYNLVKQMIEEKKYRLIVNINDLRRKNPDRAYNLLEHSFEEILPFQRALKTFVENIDTDYAKSHSDFFVGFEGSFGRKHTTPRTLTSKFLGNLVCAEGIVVRCSLVRPKVVKSVHYCAATKSMMERNYSDLTSFDAFPSSLAYPTQDEDGNTLETEFGYSIYKDHQTLTIQEMPEKAPAGQLPRSVDVICNDDLVDMCKPGDRVQVIGNFRCLPGKKGGYTTGAFRTVLLANNVTVLTKEATLSISHDDVTKCKNLSKKQKNIFELLSRSLAPSIHGHEYVKKAILCLLMGGNEKILGNGSRLRGDINLLLIGDPSVAKSQLLRYVLSIAPRAITTTGRGSSGVGLTAAVTSDPDTGERRLEAGAMVLADRGVICIDEFDKMSDIDRTAIHEVMEQGKVTIAKAGIHASLNARCSVLAAANPVYGRYDQYKTPMENIGLQDSLLSRFDLLFVMLDTCDADVDHIISDHVVRMHRYRNPNEKDGEALPFNIGLDYLSTKNPDADELDEQETQVYETYNPLLHGKSRKKSDEIFTVNFMRKWIHIARCMKTKLTDGACRAIQEEYQRLRAEDNIDTNVAKTQPITPRTLETLIRLSTAHAKTRLSKDVTEDDVSAAKELVQFAYFKRVLQKEKKRRRRDSGVSVDGDDDDDNRRTKRTKKNKPAPGEPGHDIYDYQEEEEDDAHIDEAVTRATRLRTRAEEAAEEASQTHEPLAAPRLQLFSKLLNQLFQERRTEELPKTDLLNLINMQTTTPFTKKEFESALAQMSAENRIMVSNNLIYRV